MLGFPGNRKEEPMAFQINRYGVVGRWTIYGAFLGVALIVLGGEFYPWEGSDQIAFNIGRLLGGAVGVGFLFAMAAFIRKAITKED